MARRLQVISFAILCLVALPRCGEVPPRNQKPPPTDPAPTAKSAAEISAIELDRKIASLEKELSELRAQAAKKRAVVVDNFGVRAFQKVADLMPEDSWPSPIRDGGIERIKATRWWQDKVVGKRIELHADVSAFTVDSTRSWYWYKVNLAFGKPLGGEDNAGEIGSVRVGSVDWKVALRPVEFSVTEGAAKRLRTLKDESVTLVGELCGAEFQLDKTAARQPVFFIELYKVEINGFDPDKSGGEDAAKK
jgi:hypothetical protein